MRFILVLSALLFYFTAPAQTGTTEKVFDKAPEFPGGMQGVQEYLKVSVRYPEDARKANVEGKVQVKFAIDEVGAVTDVSIMKSVHPSLDNEAIRVVKAMPNWKPGTLNNKNVKVVLALPIVFALTDPKPKQ